MSSASSVPPVRVPKKGTASAAARTEKGTASDLPRGSWALVLAGPVAGVLASLAFPDLGWWPLSFVAWAPLIAVLPSLSPGRAFLAGWAGGATALAVIFPWIAHTAESMSGFPPLAAAGVLVAYALGYGLGWGLLGLVARGLLRAPGAWGRAAIATVPAAAVALEFQWPLLFPFHTGNTFWRVPVLVQGFDLVGVYGGTAVAWVVATAAALGLRAWRTGEARPWKRDLGIAAAVLAAWVAYGAVRLPEVREVEAAATDRVKLVLVQPDIVPTEKLASRGDAGIRASLVDRLWALTRSVDLAGVDAVVWPEGAFPFRFHPEKADSNGEGSRKLEAETAKTGVPLVFGTTTRPGTKSRNTAVMLGADGREVARYDKRRLLAFGEYLPGSDLLPFLKGKVKEVADMEAGDRAVAFPVGRFRALASICYEAILPAFTRDVVVETGADVILNGTNDGWFGDVGAPRQHLMVQAARAVELRTPLVRTTMTGITAVVSASGDLPVETGVHERRAVPVEVPVRAGLASVYAATGDVFAWTCVAAVLATLGAAVQRKGKKSRSTTTG